MSTALAALAAFAVAASTPPSPTRWVEDHVGFLSPASLATLDARLEGYERATGHQVVVWIGETLQGAPLDEWAARTFAAWKVGRKGLDDGIVMFVLADDRTIDLEVGYGLEDEVPDATASRIIREIMAPRLRAGDRDGAVAAGVEALLAAIEGHPWTGTATTAPRKPELSLLEIILGGVALVGLLIFVITHPRQAMWILLAVLTSSRRTDGRSGGRGFGGGGGRSGGGGARGGW